MNLLLWLLLGIPALAVSAGVAVLLGAVLAAGDVDDELAAQL